ncbi:MAG: hypothetical protein QOG15_2913 [Solirubrobacteraceae bacterium]|jgi:hypothetical protein|nr:hypothetical protein [Solirubrobacteraceae bacterium]
MAHHPPTYHGSRRRQGIDFTTLAITAVASAAAAYITSKLWAPGTLPAAAATPVFVAIIREGLQKPTEVVTRAVPVRGMVRDASARPDPGPEPAPPTRVAQTGAIGEPRTSVKDRWRLAIITGLLGFLVCAVVFTVPELVGGGSIGGGANATTLWGGTTKHKKNTQTQTTTAPTRTVTTPTRTVTTPPQTQTQAAPATTNPTQTTPPAVTSTVPAPPAPPAP